VTLGELTALCLAARPVPPGAFWTAWSLAPAVVLPLLAAPAWLFAARRRLSPAQSLAFAAGWLALAAALISPLCRLAATTASGHMVQHVLLAVVAPALLAFASPRAPRARPAAASAAYAAAIWLSHAPAIYQATLTDGAAHLVQLALLIGASLLFWRSLLAAALGAAMAMALVALAHTGLLGALLTFAARPWYPIFGPGPALWGLTPTEDQQLAGLLMWVPMGGVYLLAGLAVLARWLAPPPAAAGARRP
jgi:putative membrane protein